MSSIGLFEDVLRDCISLIIVLLVSCCCCILSFTIEIMERSSSFDTKTRGVDPDVIAGLGGIWDVEFLRMQVGVAVYHFW